MTQPGVGPIKALAYVITLGDVTRFQRGKQVASYLGSDPERALLPVRASGADSGHDQQTGESVPCACCWSKKRTDGVLGLDEGFRKQYKHRCHRMKKGVAKVAAARKLAVRLFWMPRTNTAYPEIARIESKPARWCGRRKLDREI